MWRMGLVAHRSLYAVCTDWKTTFLTSPHPQLFVNMQFALVQSSYQAGFIRDLTRMSIGGLIPCWMGRMGLVAHRNLYAVSIDWRTTFLTSRHPYLSVNMQFALVESSQQGGISREFTRISIGGAIPRWMERMGLVVRWSLYAVSTEWKTTFFNLFTPSAFC